MIVATAPCTNPLAHLPKNKFFNECTHLLETHYALSYIFLDDPYGKPIPLLHKSHQEGEIVEPMISSLEGDLVFGSGPLALTLLTYTHTHTGIRKEK
jgi:hypothetical protein